MSKKERSTKKNLAAPGGDRTLQYIGERATQLERDEEKRVVANEITKRSVAVVRDFLVQKKRVLYGGKAINDSLPKNARFYDSESTVPDYDFYTPSAKEDAVEIAQRLYRANIPYVEVKTSSIHETTFKVFADFLPIVDATDISPKIFQMIRKEASLGPEGILLASPDWLRMNMYLELSHPKGNVDRWEKVSKRLNLLNTYRPLKIPSGEICPESTAGMLIHSPSARGFSCHPEMTLSSSLAAEFISKHQLVMVGGNSLNLYIMSMKKKILQRDSNIFTSDYDVLANNAKKSAEEFRRVLLRHDLPTVNNVGFRKGIPELIPDRYRVSFRCKIDSRSAQKTVVDFYQNDNCWSYHEISVSKLKRKVRVASIETLVTFLFKWMFFLKDKLGRYVIRGKIYCIIEFLLHHQQQMKNRLFYPVPKECYGPPVTLKSIRKENWEGPSGGPSFRFRPGPISRKPHKKISHKRSKKSLRKRKSFDLFRFNF